MTDDRKDFHELHGVPDELASGPCHPRPCGHIHNCRRCGKYLPACTLPTFACPWVNEDEDQECESCTELTTREMYEAMG